MNLLAIVIQKNSFTYANCGGQQQYVPAGVDADFHGEYWATPVKEGGVFRGYTFSRAATAPTYDSFKVVKLVSNVASNGDTYWVVATTTQYNTSVGDEGATPLPTAIPTLPSPTGATAGVVPMIMEESSCLVNGANFQWDWDVITPAPDLRAYVGIDGVLASNGVGTFQTTGYTSLANLVTGLSTHLSSAGTWSSPAAGKLRLLRPQTSAGIKVGIAFTTADYTP